MLKFLPKFYFLVKHILFKKDKVLSSTVEVIVIQLESFRQVLFQGRRVNLFCAYAVNIPHINHASLDYSNSLG